MVAGSTSILHESLMSGTSADRIELGKSMRPFVLTSVVRTFPFAHTLDLSSSPLCSRAQRDKVGPPGVGSIHNCVHKLTKIALSNFFVPHRSGASQWGRPRPNRSSELHSPSYIQGIVRQFVYEPLSRPKSEGRLTTSNAIFDEYSIQLSVCLQSLRLRLQAVVGRGEKGSERACFDSSSLFNATSPSVSSS